MTAARTETITADGIAHGGEAVGRLADGKACFVAHAIPGETVVVAVEDERKRFARGTAVEVVEPSPHRVTPPCPHFGPGRCGGCRLQHISPAHQAVLLRRIVTEQLERIARLEDPPVAETVRPHGGDGLGYRNRARFTPDGSGHLGFHRAASHEVEPVATCPLLEPAAQAAREAAGDTWQGVDAVVVRSDADGHRSIEVHPGDDPLPPLTPHAPDTALIGTDGPVALRGDPRLREQVGEVSLRVSPTVFFQPSRAGASALTDLVRTEAAVRTGERVLDAYAGVGLFGAALAADGGRVTAVEGDPLATEDALVNLPADAEVITAPVPEAVAELAQDGERFGVVVLDPPRKGAGPESVVALADRCDRTLVYVSCDPAALARDTRALIDHGWRLARATPVDQFTHSAHVEIVARFERPA
ncbi:class I SAM-dependent RNA methyltransferase [Egibacter rhizosphaerae]|uniref:Class I SAM-dependent RNA methyltransferase n=1 Tax=Egibacter rhizosphaerae TaxID=1670831 RepID=A0A411YDZ5_9ACTN|nr:TRAM domain-containing protein [Egibacter rhizosphaerae]QBI19425.1 class I SAM-dependent RNA methyltransferase [Egibacter rhizosphaerae]